MTKLTTILTVLMMMTFSNAYAQKGKALSPEVKKKAAAEFKSFREENLKLRMKHQDELYELQIKALKENHEKAKKFFKDISGIEDDIEFGNKAENKKVQGKLKKKRKEFKDQMKSSRKKVKETIQAKRKSFQEMMKKRRKDFKEKVKSMRKG